MADTPSQFNHYDIFAGLVPASILLGVSGYFVHNQHPATITSTVDFLQQFKDLDFAVGLVLLLALFAIGQLIMACMDFIRWAVVEKITHKPTSVFVEWKEIGNYTTNKLLPQDPILHELTNLNRSTKLKQQSMHYWAIFDCIQSDSKSENLTRVNALSIMSFNIGVIFFAAAGFSFVIGNWISITIFLAASLIMFYRYRVMGDIAGNVLLGLVKTTLSKP